jgi:transposase
MIYTMNDEELKKLHVINCALEGKLTVSEAANVLGLTARRVKQLKKEVKEHGVESIIHGNRGRKPAHSIDDKLAQRIIELKTSYKYQEANFLHFQELLEEYEGIKISYSALYDILHQANIKSPKKHRKTKKHHRRKRKAAAGMMLQADGTPHDWFGIGKKYSLHGFIDDATGAITGLYLCENECLLGYLEVTRQTLKNFGIPLSLYPDKYSVFFPAAGKEDHLTIEEQLRGVHKAVTQFGRIMDELGIEMFPASSPQAKGRIERLWETLQSRLVTEFRINSINTIEQANVFLPGYIKKYNKKFAIPAQDQNSAFIPLPDKFNLDTLLCVKIVRTTDNAGVFSINNCKFAVDSRKIPSKAKITVLISKDAGIKALYKDKLYKVSDVNYLSNKIYIPNGSTLSRGIQLVIQDYFLKDAKAA